MLDLGLNRGYGRLLQKFAAHPSAVLFSKIKDDISDIANPYSLIKTFIKGCLDRKKVMKFIVRKL